MSTVFIDDNLATGSNTGANWENALNTGNNATWTTAIATASNAGDKVVFEDSDLTTLTADFAATVNANHTLSNKLQIIRSSNSGGGTTIIPSGGIGTAGNGEIDCNDAHHFLLSGNYIMSGMRLTSMDSQSLHGGTAGRGVTYENCLILSDRSTAETFAMGSGGVLHLVDTTLEMINANHVITFSFDGAGVFMHGGALITDSNVARIFQVGAGKMATIEMDSVDCTGINAATDLHQSSGVIERLISLWRNCEWNAALPPLWGSALSNLSPQSRITISGPQFKFGAQYSNGGVMHETTIIRDGGADTGSQTFSHKVEASSTATRTNPLRYEFAVANPGNLNGKTVKIHFANNKGAATNDQVWTEMRVATSSGMITVTDRNLLGASATTHTDESGSVVWKNGAGDLTSHNEQSSSNDFVVATTGALWITLCVADNYLDSDDLYADPEPVITTT